MCDDHPETCRYSGRGLIQLLILRTLFDKRLHGYEIMGELERMTDGRYAPEPGSIYTMLRRMEKSGLLESEWKSKKGRIDRRMYALTDSGREVLRNGLRMIRERKPVLEALLRFYDAEFKGEKGDG